MAKKNNPTVLDQLLGKHISVEAQDGLTLEVRPLPFTTTMWLLEYVARESKVELSEALHAIDIDFGSDDVTGMIRAFIPAFTGIVSRTSDMWTRVLQDVIPDISADQIMMLPTEVGVSVVTAVIEDLDTEIIAEKVTRIFFGGKSLVTEVQKKLAATETEIETEQMSNVPDQAESK